jgi:hypothetical protein
VQFYNLVKGKPQSDKSRKESVLLYAYSSIISGQNLDKIREVFNKQAKEFNTPDTAPLYKMVAGSIK